MQRRSFLKHAGLGAVAGSAAAIAAPAFAQDMPSLTWRLASSFGRDQEILFGTAETFSKYVSEATGGKFSIKVSPTGDLAPAAEVLDAVSKATAECGHGFSSAYFEKQAAFSFDTGVPFGLNARQMNAWMYEGDGLKLTRELFSAHQIINLPLGNTGVRMGGWYRKEIKTIADLKGLKMGVGGFAAEVLQRLGVEPHTVVPAELAAALEKGELDGVDLAGPADDEKLGLAKVAKFYYYPAWWEGGAQASLYINQPAWEKLPKNYQAVIDSASRAAHMGMTARYDARNPAALQRLTAAGAELRAFPRSIIDLAFEASAKLYQELSAKDPKFKTLCDNYMGFRDQLTPWFSMAEGRYDQYLGVALSARRR